MRLKNNTGYEKTDKWNLISLKNTNSITKFHSLKLGQCCYIPFDFIFVLLIPKVFFSEFSPREMQLVTSLCINQYNIWCWNCQLTQHSTKNIDSAGMYYMYINSIINRMKYTNDFYTESVTRTQGSGYNAVAYWAVSLPFDKLPIRSYSLQPPLKC